MPRLCIFPLILLTVGCSGKNTDTGDPDTGEELPCPSEVPDDYQYRWDCTGSICDDERAIYHLGIGSSDADGNLDVEERWFWFWDEGDEYCVDTFSITGDASEVEPDNFYCSGCEEVYQVEWELTGGDCSMDYENMFNNEDLSKQEYPGYILFDTHTAFGDRNVDNAMLVVTAHQDQSSGYYDVETDFARGTAEPTSDEDGPPEDYEWVNASVMCVDVTTGTGP
ncbi:MAG: hypothetical protein QGG40_01355 [Myxococcota bacterium]|jgi:hypothetical protein|nr:hypothetical protein [Myxococcota bacterium]